MAIKALFDGLENGALINVLVEWFPGADRAQVQAALEFDGRSLAFGSRPRARE